MRFKWQVFCHAAFAALVCTGCGPEILKISPEVVARDGLVTVEGKRMGGAVTVTVAGGRIPTSNLTIENEKEGSGSFEFRIPFADEKNAPLANGPLDVDLNVGGTAKRVRLTLEGETKSPEARLTQSGARGSTFASPEIICHSEHLRFPLTVEVQPIIPDGAAFTVSYPDLCYNENSELSIALPQGVYELSSYRVRVRNSLRYGGAWGPQATVVFRP